MKKFITALVFNFIMVSICFSQSITLNSIGMHKDGEPGNFNVVPGDVVKVSVNYTSTDMASVQGVNFNGIENKIMFYGFSVSEPTFPPNYGSQLNITDWDTEDINIGTDKTATFKFTVPAASSSNSFQLTFGLSGMSSDYTSTVNGTTYSSYVTIATFTATENTASGDYQSYMGFFSDEETLAPILYTPASPTIATYDNETLLMSFKLTEKALSGSVKIYFSPNDDGSLPTTTLTLASNYENTLHHLIQLDAKNFSQLTSGLISVEGATSLTHLNTYYVAIGYKDEFDNPESFSNWNKLIYDNKVDFPSNCWGLNYYSQIGGDITITFTLSEPTIGDIVLRIAPNSADGSEREIQLSNYVFVPGENSITIKGNDFSSSVGFVALLDGVNYLTSGIDYRYQLTVTDIAGNVGTSLQSDPKFFFWDSTVNIETEFTEADPNYSFNASLVNEYQNLGILKFRTVSGISELNSLSFEIDEGSCISDKISHIKIDNDMHSLGIVLDYEGPKTYTFPNIDEEINTTWTNLYISFQINYIDVDFCQDNYISLTINEDDINTIGTISSFSSTNAKKYICQCLIVDFINIKPTAKVLEKHSPFFRLDLNTNDGSTLLSNLVSFRIMGTISESDLLYDKIYLWESSSSTFDQETAQLIQSRTRNSEINFNVNRTITTAIKYYYFTIIFADDFDPTHTIFGNIINSNDIQSSSVISVASSGFPLNDESIADETLPVELSSFTTTFTLSNGVSLKWITESETNVSGYHLYRNGKESFDTAERINSLLLSNGIENGTQVRYSYTDNEIEINSTYYYWLECLEYDGFSNFYGPYSVYTDEDIIEEDNNITGPQLTQLLSAYPNPFNPDITIPYKLVENNSVEISIFNIKGQKVRSFIRNNQEAGDYSIYFDGKNSHGETLSSGIYFYKMKTDNYFSTKKMILMK